MRKIAALTKPAQGKISYPQRPEGCGRQSESIAIIYAIANLANVLAISNVGILDDPHNFSYTHQYICRTAQ
jgi:hypothetical protein